MDTRSFFCCLNEVEILFARLFGRSLEGMNATGTSDMQNYYEMIATKQDAQLRPILEKLLPVIAMSVWGAVPDDLDFEFNSVRQPDDKELTDLAKNGSDSVIAVYNAGLVSQQTALRELKQQSVKTGIWTNITDEDIEKANSELEQLPEEDMSMGMEAEEDVQKVTDADFNSADHPRGQPENKGQFISAGGGAAENGLQSAQNNGRVNVSPRGANKFKVRGFISEKLKTYHTNKHLHEFPNMSEDDYVNMALDLLESPVTKGEIRGYKEGHDDTIVRYKPIKGKNGWYACGNPNTGIWSFYTMSTDDFEFKRKVALQNGGEG